MPGIKRTDAVQFSGYRLTPAGQARLFLPGFANAKVEAEAILPGQQNPSPVPLTRWNDYWISQKPLPLDSSYRFTVDGIPYQDLLELKTTQKHSSFNHISPFEHANPQKSTVMADIYLDSLPSKEQLAQLVKQNGGLLPMNNHFRSFGGNEQGLRELLPHLKQAGFTALLFKPFIGGDNLSANRYWTVDPYVLNNSFSSKAAFRDTLTTCLSNDMKVFADGAFVNQGLNGVQKLANLAHGFRSPYWNWFTYNEAPEGDGPISFPKHAYEKDSWAVLPTIKDKNGRPTQIAYDRFALRVLNDPEKPGYDPRDWSFVQLYDPNTETADGKPLQAPYEIKASGDSVQKLQIPITPEELKDKRALLYRPASTLSDADRARLCEWNTVRLTANFKDDSGFKWDGQVDVAKLNMRNLEVVHYIRGALGYWTQMVSHLYTETVARALGQAQATSQNGSPLALLDAITQKPGEKPTGLKILPPVLHPDLEGLSLADAEQAMRSLRPMDPERVAPELAGCISHDFPLSALPLPVMFKATLSYPGLERFMRQSGQSTVRKMLAHALQPLTRLPLAGSVFVALQDVIAPPTFERRLRAKMNQVLSALQSLSPEAYEKMRHSNVQSLVAEKLAERLYMKIFTNLDDAAKASPQEIQRKFLDTIPQAIYKNDPETAAALLPRFLRQRLAQVDPVKLASLLKDELDGLDPKLAALAEAAVQKREYGLNWRIDAAKDVGNMDQILNMKPEERPQASEAMLDTMLEFWNGVADTIRKINPKVSIIAELTDFHDLANYNEELKSQFRNKMFKNNTFTGTPTVEFTLSQPHELLHFNPRPDEFGKHQLTPSEFIRQVLEPMSQTVPFPVQRQYQIFTSSHDYNTSSQTLLINPAISWQDQFLWWGLKDDLNEACNELKSKVCFQAARDKIGVQNLDALLDNLKNLAGSDAVKSKLSPDMRDFFDEGAKSGSKHLMPNPAEFKPHFIQELFGIITSEQLGLNPAQHKALAAALTERISEPSQARGMRAVIVNALQTFHWESLPTQYRLSSDQQAKFQRSLWRAIDQATASGNRHFGMEPLDIALDNLFKHFNSSLEAGLPEFVKSREFQDAFKAQLYSQANAPVRDKLLRLFALQTAMPGNPSIYLQDLFARGGGEWIKNIFVQDRNLLPVNQLTSEPGADPQTDFQKFFTEAGRILSTRSSRIHQYPALRALNNGVMLPVMPILPERPDESQKEKDPGYAKKLSHFERVKQQADRIEKTINDSGILPIVRDNGQDQVIALINTGSPDNHRDDYHDRVGSAPIYKEIKTTKPIVTDHKPDLSALHLAPGTRYIDVHTQEAFRINEQGHLVSERHPDKGLDVHVSRFLVRENQGNARHPDAAPPTANLM